MVGSATSGLVDLVEPAEQARSNEPESSIPHSAAFAQLLLEFSG